MVRAQLGRSGDSSLFAARREGRTVQRHWTVLVRDSVCSEQARSVRASAGAFPRVCTVNGRAGAWWQAHAVAVLFTRTGRIPPARAISNG